VKRWTVSGFEKPATSVPRQPRPQRPRHSFPASYVVAGADRDGPGGPPGAERVAADGAGSPAERPDAGVRRLGGAAARRGDVEDGPGRHLGEEGQGALEGVADPVRQRAERGPERAGGAEVDLPERDRRAARPDGAERDGAGRVVDPGHDPRAAAEPQLDRHDGPVRAGRERGPERRVAAGHERGRAPVKLRRPRPLIHAHPADEQPWPC
jgi:hypothetical protein